MTDHAFGIGRAVMPTAFDYREMARECMKEADATKDVGRKKALRDIAMLYTQTALSLEGVSKQDNEQPLVRADSGH
jgi:hypothetical protein